MRSQRNSNQLVYYCQEEINTGPTPDWALLYHIGVRQSAYGQPLPVFLNGLCNLKEFNARPSISTIGPTRSYYGDILGYARYVYLKFSLLQ